VRPHGAWVKCTQSACAELRLHMLKCLLVATIALILSHECLPAGEIGVGPRIIDGTLVPISQFPTVGKVGRGTNPFICTGTLIPVGYGEMGTGMTGETKSFPPEGMIATGHTPIDFVTNTYIKWRFDKVKPPLQESDTGPGDSGGPQFLDMNGTLVLASVTSGG